ncbi:lysosomal acid lipase/cholesteryl ester hydrolase-like [Patiria miniata]|uniref:AB hydrolase-1 domain-containing protein n=1 Tax=Patiria miniata TaxID=46514 RepID=A0A914AD90_PATMI|nr:lysosomal acid lipase/cholesteryl ester hydrolase-like [Patiria miniata]XP_038061447.1 lysosomal acid lipase/cholesteryl ester hydrolase-like [Patiria miniata]
MRMFAGLHFLSSKLNIWLFVLFTTIPLWGIGSSISPQKLPLQGSDQVEEFLGSPKSDDVKISKTDQIDRLLKVLPGLLRAHGYRDVEEKLKKLRQRFETSNIELGSDPDTKYNVSGLIASHGYPVEVHEVHTVDGFILTLQRIPYGVKNKSKGPREVAFLQHGLLAAASNWVTNLPNQSLAYLLADAGYDVWMGNSRGNTYSRKHETLKPDQQKFWEWTWDEMAKYDLPACLNYVLNKTGQKEMYYIGHSQGTMIAFAEFSRNQELAKKVKMFFAMGPVATVGYMTSTLFRFLADDVPDNFLTEILVDLGLYDFFPSNEFFHFMGDTVCSEPETVFICEAILGAFGGYSKDHMNASRIPVYVNNCPAGTSVWNMDHWAQMVQSKKCSMYDFGPKGNMEHYNQTTPPVYHIENMQTPTALFYGGRDTLADLKDVELLIPKIKHLFYNKEIPTYGHLDFIWAIDAESYCYKDILGLMMKGP